MIRLKKTMTNTFPRWLCNSYLCVVNESSVTSYLHFDIFTFKFYYTGWAIVDLSFIWWLVVLNIRIFFLISYIIYLWNIYSIWGAFLVAQMIKKIFLQCRILWFNSWVGKSAGEGNRYPLQYSCSENSMDRGVCCCCC